MLERMQSVPSLREEYEIVDSLVKGRCKGCGHTKVRFRRIVDTSKPTRDVTSRVPREVLHAVMEKWLSKAPKPVAKFLKDVSDKHRAKRKIEMAHIHHVIATVPYFALGKAPDEMSDDVVKHILDSLSGKCTKCKMEIPAQLLLIAGHLQKGGSLDVLESMDKRVVEILSVLAKPIAAGRCPNCGNKTVEIGWNQ